MNGSVPGSGGRTGDQVDRCGGEETWLAAVHGPASESQVVAALTLKAHLQYISVGYSTSGSSTLSYPYRYFSDYSLYRYSP